MPPDSARRRAPWTCWTTAPRCPQPHRANSSSGHLMCYKNRTSLRAVDRWCMKQWCMKQVVYEAASNSGILGSGGELGLVLLADGESLGETFEGHVAAGDQPVVVLLGKHGADQADHGGAIGERGGRGTRRARRRRCAFGSGGGGVPAGCWTRSGASARWGRR
jgi:hypothetical protein